MPRLARQHSQTGMYHILMEAVPDEYLFRDKEDRFFFLKILFEKRIKYQYKLLAYCLLGQAYHLIIHEHKSELATIMKSINVTYASYVHKKYGKSGSFFKDRFKSQCLDQVEDILNCICHIHLQALDHHLANRLDAYQWSSYGEYIAQENSDLIDKKTSLALFGLTHDEALSHFKDRHTHDHPSFLVHEVFHPKLYPTLLEARVYIDDLLNQYGLEHEQLGSDQALEARESIIIKLRENTALSINDLAHELGIKRSQVMNAIYHK